MLIAHLLFIHLSRKWYLTEMSAGGRDTNCRIVKFLKTRGIQYPQNSKSQSRPHWKNTFAKFCVHCDILLKAFGSKHCKVPKNSIFSFFYPLSYSWSFNLSCPRRLASQFGLSWVELKWKAQLHYDKEFLGSNPVSFSCEPWLLSCKSRLTTCSRFERAAV